ncbi:mg2+ transporter zinc transport [Fusarium beomiforme]|uniref:Mg2+ transporter zinc transport n=1 Tax=Fusarium beomiforme TaxID=44412 RepID=A0A9P5DXX7_9HYPO|nr:mg2+ transporter zinc transport [Fusarium beomiforme]
MLDGSKSDGQPTKKNEDVCEELVKVAVGFLFNGDFFDRYWTCHFLESNPEKDWDESTVQFEVRDILEGQGETQMRGLYVMDEKKSPWRQRRVLELLLFQRMMDRMRECTIPIIDDAKQFIRGADVKWKYLDFNTFRQVSGRCQAYQQMLQTVDQDLTENFAKIEQWLNRERERQTERPRWTFNDEMKYRGIISKLLVRNDHSIQDLRRSHASISTLSEDLAIKLETMRNNLDQRRADDIKRFTYVTVVFLPLAFATGIFSMSEAPAGQTLWRMVVTAVTALAATFILLLLSERLEAGVKHAKTKCREWIPTITFVWSIKKKREEGHGPEKVDNNEREEPERHSEQASEGCESRSPSNGDRRGSNMV